MYVINHTPASALVPLPAVYLIAMGWHLEIIDVITVIVETKLYWYLFKSAREEIVLTRL